MKQPQTTKIKDINKPNAPFPRGIEKKYDAPTFKKHFLHHLHHTLAKDQYTATSRDLYFALAYTVRDTLMHQWIDTQQRYYDQDKKRVYYISLEFLIGRTLGNSLVNLDLLKTCEEAIESLGLDLETIREMETDAGLGNGGLGRLAACFLDSIATLGISGYGYGIRYEYGIFYQKIRNGNQVEVPDNWLRYGNPWEIARPEYLYPVNFYGKVHQFIDANGKERFEWTDTEEVMAMAYDTPVPGYQNDVVNTLRLWSAKSSREFEFAHFNQGNYFEAVENRNMTENISRILYPNDNIAQGKELRLKQQYFLVSATLQDILRRYKKDHQDFSLFAEKTAVQLNDTHPSLAIPELMRLLVDQEKLEWEEAWQITRKTCAYTNHTLLPEALEKWSVGLLGYVLPRHLQIIFEINQRFLTEVQTKWPDNPEYLEKMSIIEEGDDQQVRMANLAIIGSHTVNGVSELHTDLLKTNVFPEFDRHFTKHFIPKTNGITPRRWLLKANPGLSELITENIGEGWKLNLDELKKLVPLAKNKELQQAWQRVKHQNKEEFAKYLKYTQNVTINPNSLFDCQIKRIHEYKRQFLNALHALHLYCSLKENPTQAFVPRTIMFGGKAAPGYYMAKMTIKFIHAIADLINSDPQVREKLQVVFLQNYRVSLAEKVIPATELSEQISTAGMEASGTGNMKFGLNGALTIGTLDGANVEMLEEVGEDNIFIFGLTAKEVNSLRANGYHPQGFLEKSPNLQRVINLIQSGVLSPDCENLFKPILDAFLHGGDHFLVFADFDSFIEAQEKVSREYLNPTTWTEKSILNTAGMGKFSSDRTIREYAKEIWRVPVED